MASGTIRGVIMGLAVSATGLLALSIVAGPPPAADEDARASEQAATSDAVVDTLSQPPEPAETESAPETTSAPDAATVEVPAGSGFQTNRSDEAAALPPPDAAPQTASAPRLDGQNVPSVLDPSMIAQNSGALPPVDQEVAILTIPDIAIEAPTMDSATDAPDRNTDAPSGLEAPDTGERGPAVSGAPAQPDQDSDDAGGDMRPARESVQDAVPQQPRAMQVPSPQEAAPQRQSLPRIEATPRSIIPDPTAPAAPEAPEPMSTTETTPAFRPTIGNLATSLVDRPAVTAESDSDTDAQEADEEQTPLQRNALPFEDAENRPRLSIILMDRGDSAVPVEALSEFPYPLTFAVDANRAGAAEAAARYKAAGFEVMVLVDMDGAATAQDAETALEFALSAVPDATAVMEGDAGGFQSSKEVSDQVAAILRERGYGLVMRPNGLNTAQKLAARAGVPSATIFRDFDGAGQDAAAIRRFLDQGAFKAGQRAGEDASLIAEDGVIMLGRLRPDTISALLLWGLQDRSRRVALAPVSAVLTDPE